MSDTPDRTALIVQGAFAAGPRPESRGGWLAGVPGGMVFRVVDGGVVCFAVWTLVYQGALAMGGPLASTRVLGIVLCGIVLAYGAGILVTGRLGRNSLGPVEAEPESRLPLPVAAVAVAAAVLSLVANRPDLDDVFYVNRSSAVEQLGILPLRDTMFSDQVFAMIPASYPPIASYEALLGTIANLLGVQAASVTYYILPPVGSVVAVLALWRLLASWQLARPQAAFFVATAYLLFGGAFHASFGNTWLERMWQGKIIFISALVPMLLVYLARVIRDGRRVDGLLVASAVVAGVGLSSSGLFLMPAFLAAAGAAAALLGRWRRLVGLLFPTVYLTVVGIAWALTSTGPGRETAAGAAAPEPRWSDTVGITTKALGAGPYLLLGLAATAVGWMAIRRREARLLVLVLVAGTAFTVSPLGLALMELVGLPEPLRWRFIWLVPVPALVGALGSAVAALLRSGLVASVLMVLVIAQAGLPIWSEENGVTIGRPTWKWPADSRAHYANLAEVLRPADVVGVGEPTGALVAAASAQYWSVSQRPTYTIEMGSQSGFCVKERFAVANYASGARPLDDEVIDAIDQLGITVLSLPGPASPDEELLVLGFEPSVAEGILRRVPESANDSEARCAQPTGRG